MKKFSLFMLMAVGLLISGNLWAEKTLVAEMTALEQTTSFYWEEGATGQGNVYASAYNALTAALAALPDNSTPAKVKLFSDVAIQFEYNYFSVNQYQNVTLDLNGHRMDAKVDLAKNSAVIKNYGTLTIMDSSTGGIISNFAPNADIKDIPGFGNYTILNMGTVILNSGTLENLGTGNQGGACYCVENEGSATFIMNGGNLHQPIASAVRINATNGNTVNSVTINDGEIYAGKYCVVTHYNSSGATAPVNFTMNGGTLIAADVTGLGYDAYYSMSASGTSELGQQHVIITGGTINGTITLGGYTSGNGAKTTGKETIEISGGTFTQQPFFREYNKNYDYTEFITGGIFKNFNNIGSPKYTYGGYAYKNKYPQAEDLIAAFENFTYTNDGSNWTVTGSSYDQEDALFSVKKYPQKEDLIKALKESSIISGEEYWGSGFGSFWAVGFPTGETLPSDFDKFGDDEKNYIAEGYKAIPCTDEGFNPATDLIISTLDKQDVPVGEGEKNLSEIVPGGIKEDGTTEITIIPNTTEGQTTIINITDNTNVNKIKVTTTAEKGEAQIVVKNGKTLNVGNGGIVSENNILTTVLVETGGTLVVGTGGVEQDGLATPIKIQTSEEDGTGVLVFSPNSQTEKTKNYAEVDLYTYCKQVGEGKYTWQHFAIPVTGIADEGEFKPVASEDVYSYIFDWDYKTYSWHQLDAWSKLNTPFAGYDITNESSNGGVVYTFKGNLIGNQNTQLTLPNKNYCVMGNSYTAPIDLDALFDQIKKEMDQEGQDIIEQTVYKYDAKKKYYVWTNKLGLELAKAGILDPEFVDIKPMEGFLLNLQNGNTAGVMLNYANAVFNPAMDKANGIAQAPRMNRNTDLVIAKINVTSAHSTDLVTLVEGDEFSAAIENGKDAFKYLNEGANLYAFDGTNKLAMVATDNLEGTMLAFQAAEDAEYTLMFDRALNTEYVLVDMMNGNEVAMTEGNTYTFFATPNTLDPARFMVKANAQAPTNMERTKATKVAKGIYTITGQYLGESDQWNAMPQGVYMVNGIKVIK